MYLFFMSCTALCTSLLLSVKIPISEIFKSTNTPCLKLLGHICYPFWCLIWTLTEVLDLYPRDCIHSTAVTWWLNTWLDNCMNEQVHEWFKYFFFPLCTSLPTNCQELSSVGLSCLFFTRLLLMWPSRITKLLKWPTFIEVCYNFIYNLLIVKCGEWATCPLNIQPYCQK